MKYNKLIRGLFFVALIATTVGCSDDDSNLFEDPHFAAFLGNNANIATAENTEQTEIKFGITKAQAQDVTLNLKITDQTAKQGEHYTLSATSVVIPAGQYNGSIMIYPIDDNVFNASRTLKIEISEASAQGLQIGNADVFSHSRTVVISNDDCPSQSNLWWGNLNVEDVGEGEYAGTGASNSAGDCDVLSITSDLPNAGAGSGPFNLYFTPDSPGATTGTVDVPAQLYCTNCSGGLDANYSATGTYDESTKTIILFYSLDRTDGANFWTGTNIITVE